MIVGVVDLDNTQSDSITEKDFLKNQPSYSTPSDKIQIYTDESLKMNGKSG